MWTWITNAILLWPVFLLVIWRVGCVFYTDKKKRICFSLFSILTYVMAATMEGREVIFGIFEKNWSGLTILSCIVMPLAFSCIVAGINGKTKLWLAFLEVAVLVAVGQLCDAKGGFYIGLMLVLFVATVVVRKGYAYVASSGSFKKRV